jgi:HPt (histidine-containing phosphotransfer) domain-containing protein
MPSKTELLIPFIKMGKLPMNLIERSRRSKSAPVGVIVSSENQETPQHKQVAIPGTLQSNSRFGHLKSDKFDPESLWELIDGDMELLRELIQVFGLEYPGMIAKVERSVQQGSPSELEKAAHKIKGSLLQFHGRAAAAIALELEWKGRNGSMTGAEQFLQMLKEETELLMKTLHAMADSGATNEQRH